MQNLIPDYAEKYGHVFSPFQYLPRDLGLDTKGYSFIKLCTCSVPKLLHQNSTNVLAPNGN